MYLSIFVDKPTNFSIENYSLISNKGGKKALSKD